MMSQQSTARHLQHLACLYVRQSTLQHVCAHTESTARQDALRERAVALGWPAERMLIIDQDLGQSGTSAADRAGFQRLVAEVGYGDDLLAPAGGANAGGGGRAMASGEGHWARRRTLRPHLPHDPQAVLDLGPRGGYPQALVDDGCMLSLSRGARHGCHPFIPTIIYLLYLSA
jgi:hypothetical protein